MTNDNVVGDVGFYEKNLKILKIYIDEGVAADWSTLVMARS